MDDFIYYNIYVLSIFKLKSKLEFCVKSEVKSDDFLSLCLKLENF